MFSHSSVWYSFNVGHFRNVWNALPTVSSGRARQVVVHILFFLTCDCFMHTYFCVQNAKSGSLWIYSSGVCLLLKYESALNYLSNQESHLLFWGYRHVAQLSEILNLGPRKDFFGALIDGDFFQYILLCTFWPNFSYILFYLG